MQYLNKAFLIAGATLVGLSASGEILDRASGIKIGQRMTLRPYVSMTVGYDSNVEASGVNAKGGDALWTISPALSLTYKGERSALLLSGHYNYRTYSQTSYTTYNGHSFGEDLRWNWSNVDRGEKGWSLILMENFQQFNSSDDMVTADGQNYSGDTRQFHASGVLQRQFSEHWHADVNASYSLLDYLNDTQKRYAYYGWDRWQVGAEAGFAPSKWTDILLSAGYMGYNQDNMDGSRYDGSSDGFSLQGGLASYMTERISYRVLAGWSRFNYADTGDSTDGFVYTVSGNWKIGESWNTMLLASSYYQPSERQQATKSRVDAISWGLAKMLVRGKLRATFDIRYRHETNEYVLDTANDLDYALDIVTGRFGLDYSFNRFLSIFGYAEYQRSFNDEADRHHGAYDYDRWRVTGGFRLSY